MSGRFRSLLFIFMAFNIFLPSTVMPARIKDISSIKGIRPNQLFGYGLVIGLNGSGDKGGTTFTIKLLTKKPVE